MDVERNKQIKNKYEDLVELYQQLLNHTEPNDLFDDVKHSYAHFVDKCIVYLNKSNNEVIKEPCIEERDIEDKYIEERYDTEKMTQMLDLCHTQNYEKMDEDSDSPNDVIVTKCGGYDELDEYGYEDDYE